MAPRPTSRIGHTADSSGHAVALPIIFVRTSGFYLFIFEPSLLVPTVGKVLVLCSPVALVFFFCELASHARCTRRWFDSWGLGGIRACLWEHAAQATGFRLSCVSQRAVMRLHEPIKQQSYARFCPLWSTISLLQNDTHDLLGLARYDCSRLDRVHPGRIRTVACSQFNCLSKSARAV